MLPELFLNEIRIRKYSIFSIKLLHNPNKKSRQINSQSKISLFYNISKRKNSMSMKIFEVSVKHETSLIFTDLVQNFTTKHIRLFHNMLSLLTSSYKERLLRFKHGLLEHTSLRLSLKFFQYCISQRYYL